MQFETDFQSTGVWHFGKSSLLKSVANCIPAYFPPRKKIDTWNLYHQLFLKSELLPRHDFLRIFIIDSCIWDGRRKLPEKNL